MNEVIVCIHCHKDPGPDQRNPSLWYGFLDKDTKEHCCMPCRRIHYQKKSKTEHANKYTEFPVTYKTEDYGFVLGEMRIENNITIILDRIRRNGFTKFTSLHKKLK